MYRGDICRAAFVALTLFTIGSFWALWNAVIELNCSTRCKEFVHNSLFDFSCCCKKDSGQVIHIHTKMPIWLSLVKVWYCCTVGRMTIGLTSYWQHITDLVVKPPVDSVAWLRETSTGLWWWLMRTFTCVCRCDGMWYAATYHHHLLLELAGFILKLQFWLLVLFYPIIDIMIINNA